MVTIPPKLSNVSERGLTWAQHSDMGKWRSAISCRTPPSLKHTPREDFTAVSKLVCGTALTAFPLVHDDDQQIRPASFIISGEAGTGKSTLIKHICEEVGASVKR